MPALWMTELAVTAAVANADLKLAAKMRVVAAGIRIAVLLAFVVTVVPSVDSWAWFFAVGNVVAALASYWLLAGSLGGFPRPSLPRWREFVTGFPYGVGNTTEGVLAASDRPLLAQYNFGYESGIYAAGYRIVSLGFMPLRSLLKAQDRRFFRQGSFGSNASHRAGVAMSIHGLVTTVPVTAALWLGAPYLDLVISDAYAESETVIRFLALLPVIKGFQYAFGNALTAAGNQQARMWLTGAAALGNFVGNLWLIPSGGWRAAATTTLVAEIGLAVGFAIATLVYARIDRD
jgi:O-antigen/teichoic acid export membrane protein